jgi:hypothetical protein
MGFKEFMDQNGKFITESDAQSRVQEMKQMREQLLRRLEMEKHHQLKQQQVLAQAHEQDVRDHNVHTTVKQQQQRQHIKKLQQPQAEQDSENAISNAADPVVAAAAGSSSSS